MGADLFTRLFSLQQAASEISGRFGIKAIGLSLDIRKTEIVNRRGNLDELRSTALFLATCPSFLTGTEIYVDGGHTLA